jgi:3-hydroxyisobutyrate dehydrogenase-like beta-hydroxyacid dehydrogenase
MIIIDKNKTRVGFAGLGLMGNALVHRLADGGWNLRVWNRSPQRTEEFKNRGMAVDPTPAELAANADLIMSSLANDQAALEVYLGMDGIFTKAKSGSIILEMSTLSPQVSLVLHAKAKDMGIHLLDIPIAGSTPAVKAGTITLLAGGSKEVFDACVPLFETIAKQWFLMGPAGSGAQMKLVVNLLLGVGMQAIAESVSLGESLGIDRNTLLSVLSKTAVIGPAFVGKFDKIQKGDYSPQFPLRLMHKDLGLVLKEAHKTGIALPAAAAAHQVTGEIVKDKGDLDLSAITPWVARKKV